MVALQLVILDVNDDVLTTSDTIVLNDQFDPCGRCVMKQSLVTVQSTIVLRVDDATIRTMVAWIRLSLHGAVDVFVTFGQVMNDGSKKRFVTLATECVSMIVHLSL